MNSHHLLAAVAEHVGDRFECLLTQHYIVFSRRASSSSLNKHALPLARLILSNGGMVMYRDRGHSPEEWGRELDPADPDFLDQIVTTLELWSG